MSSLLRAAAIGRDALFLVNSARADNAGKRGVFLEPFGNARSQEIEVYPSIENLPRRALRHRGRVLSELRHRRRDHDTALVSAS